MPLKQRNQTNQVTRTLLSIPAELINASVWMFFTRAVIFKSSSLCTNALVTVPRASITIGIIVTFMFHSFFHSPARSWLLLLLLSFFFLLSFNNRGWQFPCSELQGDSQWRHHLNKTVWDHRLIKRHCVRSARRREFAINRSVIEVGWGFTEQGTW